MEKYKEMLPMLGACALAFYILPLMMNNTGMASVMFLIFMPIICLICSILYGLKGHFNFLYAGFVAVIFASTVTIYYNMTAFSFIFIYGIISLIGNLIGYVISKYKK